MRVDRNTAAIIFDRQTLVFMNGNLNLFAIARQRFIDGVQQDFARQKQLRLHLKDIQLQCGPDVTAINVTWEKRFLELRTFQPALATGRMSVLLHRNREQWRLAAVGGDSPFGASASGTAGDLDVAASVDVSRLAAVAPQSSSDDAAVQFDRMSEEDLLRGLENLAPPVETDDEGE